MATQGRTPPQIVWGARDDHSPCRSPAGLSGDLLGAGRGADLEEQTVRLALPLLPTGFVVGQPSELSPREQEEWVRALKEDRLLR
jgi:hypothetical protein